MTRSRRAPLRARRAGEHLRLSALFVATRLGLLALGLRFNFELDWMFLCDPGDLRARLFDCVYYFHAYPPGMNLLAGLLLQLFGRAAGGAALVVFWALGLALVNALFFALRVLAVPSRWAFAVAVAFSLLPQTIYFEHLFLWEHVVAASLACAAACFYVAVARQSTPAFALTFALAAVIGCFRSTFHLVWFVALVGLALACAGRAAWRRVLVGAAAPAVLLLALYLKNWALFGVFGSNSAGGGNLTHITVEQLSREERAEWVAAGRLSPLATLGVYAGPAAYLPYFSARTDGRSPILDALTRPTFGSANYNHWVMLPAMRTRQKDALAYLSQRPLDYAATAWRGLLQFLGPATDWHPRHGKPGSPHYQHEQVLGPYTHAYNAVVHAGPGVYALLPLVLAWAVRRLWRTRHTRVRRFRARAALLAFALLQVVYVTLTSACFTIGESARYRHQIEALLWLVVAAALAERARSRRRARLQAELGTSTPTT